MAVPPGSAEAVRDSPTGNPRRGCCTPLAMTARLPDEHHPVVAWLAELATRADIRVVAVSGPQGAGKSTVCARAVETLRARGLRAVTVSIDDFYLTHDAQRALAARFEGNRYLEHRGYPGTHDVALGRDVIAGLCEDRGAGVAVPVYDKSTHEGRGDRLPRERWRIERGPFDLVLVEGWMLGFVPVEASALPDPALEPANAALVAYSAWHALADAMALMVMADPSYVLRWRVDAERARRAAGAPGLTDAEALDYVLRFLPAYATWVPAMRANPPVRGPSRVVTLGEDRAPIAVE